MVQHVLSPGLFFVVYLFIDLFIYLLIYLLTMITTYLYAGSQQTSAHNHCGLHLQLLIIVLTSLPLQPQSLIFM